MSRLNPEPTPRVGLIGDPVLVDDEWIELRGTGQEVELPPELWLRDLLDLDLWDADAIVEFVAAYGVLGHLDWHSLPTVVRNVVPPRGTGMHPPLERIYKLVSARLARTKAGQAWDSRYFHHVDEFVVHAAVLRDIARIWLATAMQHPLDFVTDQWENTLHQPPKSTAAAHRWLADFLTAGLSDYQLAVQVDGYRAPAAGTYAGLCLQIANDIDEHVTYRSCANDRCGRVFYRQRGRAAKGQYKRRGVAYCSVACARAQAQREWRQRKTEMDEGEDR